MSCNFIKKDETLTHVFSYEFFEISKNSSFTEHTLGTASVPRITIYWVLLQKNVQDDLEF